MNSKFLRMTVNAESRLLVKTLYTHQRQMMEEKLKFIITTSKSSISLVIALMIMRQRSSSAEAKGLGQKSPSTTVRKPILQEIPAKLKNLP